LAFKKSCSLVFCRFAIKVPAFPFHTWLPDAHVEAPTPISVILAGVLLKMGTYGLLRFNYPFFPDAARWFQPAMAVIALIGIVYGGYVRWLKRISKKLVAYFQRQPHGICTARVAAMTSSGFSGALLQCSTTALLPPVCSCWSECFMTARIRGT